MALIFFNSVKFNNIWLSVQGLCWAIALYIFKMPLMAPAGMPDVHESVSLLSYLISLGPPSSCRTPTTPPAPWLLARLQIYVHVPWLLLVIFGRFILSVKGKRMIFDPWGSCLMLTELEQASITKFHRVSVLHKKNLFLTVLGLEVWCQGASMIEFWWRPSYWLSDSCLLAMSSHDGKRESSGISSSS